MTQRTYVPTMLQLAHTMCKYIARATPVITRLYPSNAALLAALAAANEACTVLGAELESVRDYGD